MTSITSSNNRISWDALIEFANEKKAEEQRTGRPARLNPDQFSAILKLIPFPEPEVDNTDWVSKLNGMYKVPLQLEHSLTCYPEYYQKRGQTIRWPDGTLVDVSLCGTEHQRWHNYFTPPSSDRKFPCVGYGCSPDGEVPTFSTKIKAKQFAAKQAYRFIHGDAPDSSKRPASTDRTSPPSARVKTEDEPLLPSILAQQNWMVRKRAQELANNLDYGEMCYQTERDAGADTWKGRVIFNNDCRAPDDVGIVGGIVGREETENAVAVKVLEWLEQEIRFARESAQRLCD